MSDRLAEFLVDLAVSPELAKRYSEDPQGELRRAGLTAQESAAVLAGDSEQIRTALGRSHADHLTQVGQRGSSGRPARKSAKKKKEAGSKKKKAAKKR